MSDIDVCAGEIHAPNVLATGTSMVITSWTASGKPLRTCVPCTTLYSPRSYASKSRATAKSRWRPLTSWRNTARKSVPEGRSRHSMQSLHHNPVGPVEVREAGTSMKGACSQSNNGQRRELCSEVRTCRRGTPADHIWT